MFIIIIIIIIIPYFLIVQCFKIINVSRITNASVLLMTFKNEMHEQNSMRMYFFLPLCNAYYMLTVTVFEPKYVADYCSKSLKETFFVPSKRI